MRTLSMSIGRLVALAGAAGIAVSSLAHDQTFQRGGGAAGKNERCFDLIQLASGDIYTVGSRFEQTGTPDERALGQVYDANGVMVTQLTLGTEGISTAFSVTSFTDTENSTVWAMHTSDGSMDGHELALARLLPSGQLAWAFRYVGQRYGYAGEGGAIKVVPSTNTIVVASSTLAPSADLNSGGDLLVVNGAGTQIFNNVYWPAAPLVAAVDFADVVVDDATSSYLVVGTINDTVGTAALDPATPSSDILVARIDCYGNVVWAKRYALSNPENPEADSSDIGTGLALREDGNIVVSAKGSFASNGYGSTALLLLDASGNLMSTQAIRDFQAANSATENGEGDDVVVAGSYAYGDGGLNASMLLVDSDLNLKWRYTYGSGYSGGEAALYMPDEHDSGFLLGGVVNNYDLVQLDDSYLLRTTHDGNTYCDEQPWQDTLQVVAIATNVDLLAASMDDPIIWQPELTVLATNTRDMCQPLPPCLVDFNGDGFLDFTDFDDFSTAFANGDASTDFNEDGFLDFTDFDDFVAAFEAGC